MLSTKLRRTSRSNRSAKRRRPLFAQQLESRLCMAGDAVPVVNAVPGESDVSRSFYFIRRDTFNTPHRLYRSIGTTESTQPVLNESRRAGANPQDLTWFKGKLYFSAELVDGQRELFVSDGTDKGTRTLRNLSATASSDPQDLTVAGDQLFFTAVRPSGERELFVTEGTRESTRLVHPIAAELSADPTELTAVGNNLFFVASMFDGQREIYFTDGTSAGTRRVRNLNGNISSNPRDLTVVGDKVFFSASLNDFGLNALHVSDGTFAGTRAVVSRGSFRQATGFSNVESLAAAGDKLVFTAVFERRPGVFVTDADAIKPVQISDDYVRATQLTAVGDNVFFVARLNRGDGNEASVGNQELWVTDGTLNGTRIVRDISGAVSSDPQDLVAVGKRLAFTAETPQGYRTLFRSNGTAEGTRMVSPLFRDQRYELAELTAVGNRLAFVVNSPQVSKTPYMSDLSRSGTRPFLDPARFRFDYLTDFTQGNVVRTVVPSLDANQDGNVSAADALMVINRLAIQPRVGEGEETSSLRVDVELEPVDVNQDGRVTAADALSIINYLSRRATISSINDDPLATSLDNRWEQDADKWFAIDGGELF